MKINFQNTVDELVFLSVEVTKNSPLFIKSLRKKQLTILGLYLLMSFIVYSLTQWAIFSACFLIFAVTLVLCFKRIQLRSFRRYFKKLYSLDENKVFLEKQSIEIGSKGIRGGSSTVESMFTWPSVKELIEYKDCYLIAMVTSHAWLIPKRALKKETEKSFKKAMAKVPFRRMIEDI